MIECIKDRINEYLPQNELDKILEYFPAGLIAVDLETTGLSPLINKIIEISAIKITPQNIEKFSVLINPEIKMLEENIAIHGITDEMVKDCQTIEKILPKFLDFCSDTPILAHNAKFDLGFIVFNYKLLGLKELDTDVFCSCQYSRNIHKEMPSHKLGVLCKELEIPLLNHHRAFDDAVASLRVVTKGLIQEELQHNQALVDCFEFNTSSFSSDPEMVIPYNLNGLGDRVERKIPIEIHYQGGSKKNRLRPIVPMSVILLPRGCVLYGHCLESNQHKSFALSKIKYYQDASESIINKYKNNFPIN